MKLKILTILLSACAVAHSQPLDTTRDAQLQWFDEGRFGMFIHWGVYAVPAGEWKGQPIGGIGEWIMQRAKIPVADYKAFAPRFTAAKYDPVAWARLAKKAGMKYVVITSKHHDGFALYDSAASDWNVMQSAAARDLIGPLAKAVRTEGLTFGLYYSQAQDWINPGGGSHGHKWDPAQEGNYDAYLRNIALPQVKEIVARFKPAFIWWDTPVDMTVERVKPFADFMAQHPAILNNDRLGNGFKGDTMTPEQHIPPRGYPGQRFEVCMTMNDTWGFKKNDHNWKSTRDILRNLSDISSKGGNFLLNVGPTAEGVIPPESVERLEAVGRWMKINSEAIYGSTASPFPRRLPWGRVTQKRVGTATVLYLHVWDWPSDGQLLLPTVKEIPSKGQLLANKTSISSQITPEGLLLKLPSKAPDGDVSVLRLEFPSAVTITMEPFPTPDQTGRIFLGVQDADAYGGYEGTIQRRDSGPNAYLTDWKNPDWYLSYEVKAPKAQTWVVTAEVATANPVKLYLEGRKSSTQVEVAATGPGLTWKTVTLGTLKLPDGRTQFKLIGVADGWKGFNIRNVWLDFAPTSPVSCLLPDARGVLTLGGRNAELTGGLQLESGHIGYWTKSDDTVSWRAAVAKAGGYQVSLDYACQDDSAGSEFEVRIGSKTIQGKVTGTGSWKEFKTEVLGSIDLEKSEGLTITVNATKKPGLAVMNLRSLTLTPTDSAR